MKMYEAKAPRQEVQEIDSFVFDSQHLWGLQPQIVLTSCPSMQSIEEVIQTPARIINKHLQTFLKQICLWSFALTKKHVFTPL